MPELAKLVALSELFGVSVDYLVKDYLEAPETAEGEDPARAERLEQKVDDLTRYIRGPSTPMTVSCGYLVCHWCPSGSASPAPEVHLGPRGPGASSPSATPPWGWWPWVL